MNIFLQSFALIIISFCTCFGQDAGDNLFDNSKLHEIRFQFNQANYWETMLENYDLTWNGQNVPYIMASVTIDGEFVDSVGVRFKGFTSFTYDSDKKPFKIDFNEYVKGKRYDGLKKLNLNNGTGDPAMQRDNICYEMLRKSGVSASRTSYARVYVNDEYLGVYQLIEQVDSEFLKRNFSNSDGNLFKNKGWSHLEWEGEHSFLYKETFELKTNEELDDYSGFINLLDIINNSSDEEFEETIESIFDVDRFLKTLSVDVATNNWDSYLEHGRNYYIYEDTVTGIFNWIPWDYNFSLNGGILGFPSDNCSVFCNYSTLTTGSKTVEFFDNSFSAGPPEYFWEFGDGESSQEKNPIHEYTNFGTHEVCLTISTGVDCNDTTCKFINNNNDANSCESVVSGQFQGEVNFAFATVIEWLPFCCDNWDEDCQEFYDDANENADENANFRIDQRDNTGALINRLLAVPEINERYYNHFCSLMEYNFNESYYHDFIDHNRNLIEDAFIEDPNALFSYENFVTDSGEEGLKQLLSDRIDSLSVELDRDFACASPAPPIDFQEVVINEIIASNDSTSMISDQDGEYDDWIELFNNTSGTIDLSGIYLSDSKTDFQKWQFPDGTSIGGNDYLIIWADKDEEQDGLHTNFKLNKGGDELTLSNVDGSVVDSITFDNQETNIAFAREPNGTGPFVTKESTFNDNNDKTSAIDPTFVELDFKLFPNPTRDVLYVKLKNSYTDNFTIEIFSSINENIRKENIIGRKAALQVANLEAGFYSVKIIDQDGKTALRKFIKL